MGELTTYRKQVKFKMIIMKERRDHTRQEYSCSVSYERSSPPVEWEDVPKTGEGRAVDLSESGLCMNTSDDMEDMQILKINLPVPGMPVQIPTLAMVVWNMPYDKEYRVGLKFIV